MNLYLEKELIEKGLEIYGTIKYDDGLFKSGLIGSCINPVTTMASTTKIVESIMKAFN